MNSDASKAMVKDAALAFVAVVGQEHVRPATAEDSVDGVAVSSVIEPGSPTEIAQVLQAASGAGFSVLPRGAGTKLEWGAPPRRADVVLSFRRLNRVLEHAWADMTVAVDPGCTVAELQKAVAVHGQRLALDPLWPERATIGGIQATNDSGSLRVRFGSLRDLVIGVTMALPDGTLAKSGGKVVKNVAGYDLPKLVIGSLGTLGVITETIFRLHPLPRVTRTVSFAGNVGSLCSLLLAVTNSHLSFTGLQLRTTSGSDSHLDVRFEGTSEGIEAQLTHLRSIAKDESFVEVDDVWSERERMFRDRCEKTLIVKVSTLPANFATLISLIQNTGKFREMEWRLVAHASGTGWLRVDAAQSDLCAILESLRQGLQMMQSTAVVQHCPVVIKRNLDVWGPVGDALELMRTVKKQFDPSGTLNPGRFVGGI